jgi:tetratricopeptide (TPR) repeat protein
MTTIEMITSSETNTAEIAEISSAEQEPNLLDDIDRIVMGELPFGAIFGLDADDIHAFADLADEQLAAGRVNDALTLYEGCVQLDPLDVTLLCGYATCLQHAGDSERSRQITEIILELEPEDLDVRAFLEATNLGVSA